MQSQRVNLRFERSAALRRSAQPIREWAKRSALLAIFAVLAVFALGAAGCTGIVMEPADQTSTSGSVRFWGYSAAPGDSVKLEALGTSAYEQVGTAIAATTPTSAGDSTGYYFEVWVYLPSMATRFRKASPWAGYWMATFRLSVGGTMMQTRQYDQNSKTSTLESWLSRYWFQHTTSNNTIRVYAPN